MCPQVFWKGQSYATPRELMSLLGTAEDLVWTEHKDDMDWCLCVVDVPASLERAGLAWRSGTHPSEIIVEK
jgi:hypothetical protein